MNQLYGGYQDMQAMQRERIEAGDTMRDEPVYNKPDSITEALERECMETMCAVDETEKLLCDIVMRQIGKSPELVKATSEVRADPQGSLNIAIQSLREMRAKLSVMRADVARLI